MRAKRRRSRSSEDARADADAGADADAVKASWVITGAKPSSAAIGLTSTEVPRKIS